MALTIPRPNSVKVSFDTRATFKATSVPADIDFVIAGGLMYERDATGTAITIADGSKWSPTTDHITPLHWDAKGDGVTNDVVAIQAAMDWMGTKSLELVFNEDAQNTFGTRLCLTGNGKLYSVEDEITLTGSHRNLRVEDMSLIANGTWAADTFIFNLGANATYTEFENVQMNCNNLTGGIKLRSRSRLVGCYLEKIKYVGAHCAGSDVWIDRCIIGQWTTNDVEYYDKDAYTGTGILITESDARVTGCTVRWLDTLVEIEATNNIFTHCHMFNGMKNFDLVDRTEAGKTTGDFKTALDAYFGVDTNTNDWGRGAGNFPLRSNHRGVRVGKTTLDEFIAGGRVGTNAGKSWANTFDDVYFDNCHHELYYDGVFFNNPKLGSKGTSSLNTSLDWWFRLHAYEPNATTKFRLRNFETYVSSFPKHIVKWAPYDTGTWSASTAQISSDTDLNWAQATDGIQNADGFAVERPYTHVYAGPQGSAVTYYGMGSSSSVGFLDDDTTAANPIRFGCDGELGVIRTNSGLKVTGLPTSLPAESNVLWNDSGTIKIS